jgi:hypothetical protein
MARWQGALGPTAQFNRALTTFIEIPQLFVNDTWDNGPILMLLTAAFRNSAGAADDARFQPFIDGANLGSSWEIRHKMDSIGFYGFPLTWVLRLTPGAHRIAIGACVQAGTGTLTLDANVGRLTLIQLPVWERPEDIPG